MICKVDRFFNWVTQLTVLFSYSSPGYRDASDTKYHTIYTLSVEIISWYMCKAPYKRFLALEEFDALLIEVWKLFNHSREKSMKCSVLPKNSTTSKNWRWSKPQQPVGYPMIEHVLGFNIICAQNLVLPLLYQVVKTKTFIDFSYRTASFIFCCLQRSIHLKREGKGCKSMRIRRLFIPLLQGQQL